ncbi:Dph6-related ATP pyrophosphatase [Moheibacter lacus]|uniref:Diphthine--ammonia ligase n=1 Tax=Moheibacter lacus TaxID=2745851 RepID=A0A838ZT59_9FLAO|nr:diphthine--ammonia ligase [Moheibacter lacus]MBA5630166.1 diphthine--ammonia ligase [Moheibacter lacus]
MKKKAIFNWSSGKDSALALHKVLTENEYEILALVTTVNEKFCRISMHGIREELLEKQAESIGIPLVKIYLPESPSMETYNSIMEEQLLQFKKEGVEFSIFGDIFLEDLRKYREEKLAEIGMKGVFPLWNISTNELITEFLELGFKTIVTTVNESHLNKSFVGQIIDKKFVQNLPKRVDVCGENGEFHTFCFDGPIFNFPIQFYFGETVYKTFPKPKSTEDQKSSEFEQYGFWYVDLLPK